MIINPSKFELLTKNSNDTIRVPNSEDLLYSKDTAKYLGQSMDPNGTSKDVNTRRFSGKIINILSRNPELSRKAKIRLFKTYVASKANHLILLMAITEGIKETWSTMRSIIFRNVLNKSTLQRESALFKLSYFNLIVKPVLKTLERAIRVNGPNSEIIDFYRRASSKIFIFHFRQFNYTTRKINCSLT